MLALGFGFWDDWELRDKITFDPIKRIMSVNEGVTEIDVKIDVYSAWKRWALIANNSKFRVIRSIGGDPTIGAFKAGDIYFLVNNWILQIDLTKTSMTGSLFSDDFTTPLIDFSGNPLFASFVSNLVTGVNDVNVINTPPTAQDISDQVWTDSTAPTKEQVAKAVWDYAKSAAVIAGSMGEYVGKKLLTFKKFISES